MTLNTQKEKELLRRRGSTPVAPLYKQLSGPRDLRFSTSNQAGSEHVGPPRSHPPLGHSASYHPGDTSLHYRAQWSSDSDEDSQSESDCVYRVVLLGDHGVGKTSLAGIFAGITEKDEQPGEDTYERTLTVDGEETTLLVMDTWENDKLEEDDPSFLEDCLKVGSAYVIVYSVTDRSSFDSAAELRITLRRTRQAENLPIILVGNKSDLVRAREVAVEAQRGRAVRGRGAADPSPSGRQRGHEAQELHLQTQGEPHQEGPPLPGPTGGTEEPAHGGQSALQELPRPSCTVKDTRPTTL
ncbi:GTP-binding protein REM 1 isoform X2 [Austrofundulus limnaeus]|uniref:GTP-binding protein REM 1 isoform X2 n=1 Tax=Austrofundulus limnaeus TaxID=52670 RepID=A0A2I4BUR7_AUSLI|nr:PREDICTED: GTP-binding protein REM 1-like isoform X2 [Austrofundulus limnaeus]